MTIKDFDTKKVILEDQYKSDEYETMTLSRQKNGSKDSILMLFTPKSVLSIR
jgi:uncharacterized protein (DUF1330 family)